MDYYSYYSPIGPIEIVADKALLHQLKFKDNYADSALPIKNDIIRLCVKQLDLYFSGQLETFTIPFHLKGTSFQNKVWSELLEIPYGKSISYTDLAIRLGDLKCIRAAGTANGKNKIPIIIPCHRVIGKNGNLVGFAGGIDKKEWLLKHEGIIKGHQMKIFG